MVYLGPKTGDKAVRSLNPRGGSERTIWWENHVFVRSGSPALAWIINFPPVGQVHFSALRAMKKSSTGLAPSSNEAYNSCMTDVCKHIKFIATGPRPGSLLFTQIRQASKGEKWERLLFGSVIFSHPLFHPGCKHFANLDVFLYSIRSVFPSANTPYTRDVQV